MARRDYLPDKDADLLAWTLNFSTLLTAAPTTYGITAEIATDYAAKQSDFATKLAAATNPDTRGKRTVFLKDESKKILVDATRPLAQQIGRTISVTNAQRQSLGITVPSGSRTPKPAPTAKPVINVVSVDGRTVTIGLKQSGHSRGKPAAVLNAFIFTYVGATPPSSTNDWTFALSTTRTSEELSFAPSATGDTVWITAQWVNAKSQTGPASTPVSVNLPAGGVLPQAAERAPSRSSDTPMRVEVRRAA